MVFYPPDSKSFSFFCVSIITPNNTDRLSVSFWGASRRQNRPGQCPQLADLSHPPHVTRSALPHPPIHPRAPYTATKKGAEAPVLVPHARLDQAAACFFRRTAIPTRP